MAAITFTVESSGISAMSQTLAKAIGQFDWIAAKAMTESAIAARNAIRRDIHPRIQGGPSRWTERGLIVRYARKNDLRAMVGYQYGSGNFDDSEFTPKAGGIPAGRYMGINARGGDRRPKASELQLRRAGLIRSDQFLTPASSGVRLNAQGNVSGATYQQVVSRLRGFSAAGSGQNTTSRTKRRQADYFIMRRDGAGYSRWQLGAEPVFIAKRRGRGQRGFVPAFFITDQPNYERRFPIQQVATREFQRVFPIEFQRGLDRELGRRM